MSDYVYELIVNSIGGSAGGAIMRTVFFSLNYLTGMAFFVVLFNATFKDALSSGVYLAVVTPLVLGRCFTSIRDFS